MRLVSQWLLASIGGGIAISALVLLWPLSETRVVPQPLDSVLNIVLWPVVLCEHLSGPGATIGPSGNHLHEATPVQLIVAAIGASLTWVFYSTVVFLAVRTRGARRRIPDPDH